MKNNLEKSPELKAQEEALQDTDAMKLSDDVAKVYDVRRGYVRHFLDTHSGALIDLNKITLEAAVKLEKRGVLIKKP